MHCVLVGHISRVALLKEGILVIHVVQVLLDSLLHFQEVGWITNFQALLGQSTYLSLDKRQDLLLCQVINDYSLRVLSAFGLLRRQRLLALLVTEAEILEDKLLSVMLLERGRKVLRRV